MSVDSASQMTSSDIFTQPNSFPTFPLINFETLQTPLLTNLLNLSLAMLSQKSGSISQTPLILEKPNLETIMRDFKSQTPSNQWAEPSELNFNYITNLSYLSDFFTTNPTGFLDLIKAKFPNIPQNTLYSVFHSQPLLMDSTKQPSSSEPPVSEFNPRDFTSRKFSRSQIAALKDRYKLSSFISMEECQKLGSAIQMSPKQIKSWFGSEKQRVRRSERRREKRRAESSGI